MSIGKWERALAWILETPDRGLVSVVQLLADNTKESRLDSAVPVEVGLKE